jgi:hypothetical protein
MDTEIYHTGAKKSNFAGFGGLLTCGRRVVVWAAAAAGLMCGCRAREFVLSSAAGTRITQHKAERGCWAKCKKRARQMSFFFNGTSRGGAE